MSLAKVPALVASLALVSIVAAACGAGATPTPVQVTNPPAASGATSSGAPSAVVVNAANGILVGPTGMALYTKGTDPSGCSGGCLSAWPPLVVMGGGSASAGSGVSGTVATVARADGTTQVTYNGMPLYYFASDSAPGTATGNGVGGFAVAKP